MVRRMLRFALRHRSSRSLTLASVAFVSFVLGACSKGGKDDGIDDAPARDGGAVRDSGVLPVPPGDLAGSRDPALCPVGAADGCCPLLRYGGTDPDCPSLGCSALVRSTPIQLDAAAIDTKEAIRALVKDWDELTKRVREIRKTLNDEALAEDRRRDADSGQVIVALDGVNSEVLTANQYGQIANVRPGDAQIPLALHQVFIRHVVAAGFTPFFDRKPVCGFALQDAVGR